MGWETFLQDRNRDGERVEKLRTPREEYKRAKFQNQKHTMTKMKDKIHWPPFNRDKMRDFYKTRGEEHKEKGRNTNTRIFSK